MNACLLNTYEDICGENTEKWIISIGNIILERNHVGDWELWSEINANQNRIRSTHTQEETHNNSHNVPEYFALEKAGSSHSHSADDFIRNVNLNFQFCVCEFIRMVQVDSTMDARCANNHLIEMDDSPPIKKNHSLST